ncbi:hypothetical protein AGABI2DRAFT_135615 [Agaricus bisporus var. bisporus H97]|uniref:hypothetical protein n=1 Tax=Agaricus bisporus var. bisporus (strain H97 / ATCC MYA-4626 / FGSC 10389) TaxID=936046 RepID=UPI00029F70EB|nr:hypothetical protein AGABI2DRAFT_135615 [Agaricus bisporus var. bisporus H97]EKV48535.1 hypothetical protein AGABI2DRAFT_135615 [Agaricus bisporus var. bisporus H97]
MQWKMDQASSGAPPDPTGFDAISRKILVNWLNDFFPYPVQDFVKAFKSLVLAPLPYSTCSSTVALGRSLFEHLIMMSQQPL